jgi:hypothetical protein
MNMHVNFTVCRTFSVNFSVWACTSAVSGCLAVWL